MKLIDNWKSAFKMHSVQIALIYTVAEWWMADNTIPQTFSEWVYRLIGVAFVVLRVVSQPELHKK